MIDYRLATLSDHDPLVELIALSAHHLLGVDCSKEQIDGALGTVFGVDTQLIKDGTYFVGEVDSQLIACGGWSKRQTLFGGDAGKASSVDPLLDPATEPSRIRAFFVHPDFARRGIGLELIHRCEAAAAQHKFSRMELVATLTGERLYRQAGYRQIERFDIPLVNGLSMPAVSMGKNLLITQGDEC